MPAPPAAAPIAVFAFNRPRHLEQTLRTLAACREARHSHLTVFCDGPRNAADASPTQAVREIAGACSGFASVAVVTRTKNLGLAASIIDGVSEQLKHSERVIVLEDDLVVSPHFLGYMNAALDRYANEVRVASIHGYTYPTAEKLPANFFLRGADCWGWGTWRRAWQHFDADGKHLLSQLRQRGLQKQFDLGGAYPYTAMLEGQIAGRNNSWAIRWHASCFLRDMLTLYPGCSLVQNIGGDDSGTHSGATTDYDVELCETPVPVLPIAVEESLAARQAVAAFFRTKRALHRRIANRLRRLLTRNRQST